MTTKAAEKTSLQIKRFINAPRDRVYHAWTDVRVGGKYRWDLINQEGEDMTVFGEYRELVPGKKIVFTWQWDDDDVWENRTSIVTVELSDRDGGTELLLKHEQLPSEESRDRHNEGWNSVLDRLEKFFSR